MTQELKGILTLFLSQALFPLGNGSLGETLSGSYPSFQLCRLKEWANCPSKTTQRKRWFIEETLLSHSAKAQALREIFLMGQVPRLKNQKPLLKIQQKVMFHSNMLACRKLKKRVYWNVKEGEKNTEAGRYME